MQTLKPALLARICLEKSRSDDLTVSIDIKTVYQNDIELDD